MTILPLIAAKLPGPTQFALDFSDFCKSIYGIIVVSAVVCLLWLDARMFSWIYRMFGRRKALMWFWGISILLVLISLWFIAVMYLPMWKMEKIVPGNTIPISVSAE